MCSINETVSPDAPFGAQDNITIVIAELMNPTYFRETPDRYHRAKDQVNELLRQYNLGVRRFENDTIEIGTRGGVQSAKPVPVTPISRPAVAPVSPAATAANSKIAPADVVILCALQKPELEKVMAVGSWKSEPSSPFDPSSYHSTEMQTKSGRRLRVVAAASRQMGMPAAAILATKMIIKFRPKMFGIVGIAAGVGDGQNFGDVLAADSTFDYGAGKIIGQDGIVYLKPAPETIAIHAHLRDRLHEWGGGPQLDKIRREWQANTPGSVLKLHIGPLGSGGAVLGTTKPIADVQSHQRKLIGIDMEAYGAHLACHTALNTPPMFLCMKSICDFAENKTDDWQNYAAYTAAASFRQFLFDEWELLFP